jgi:hypothetical protein
MPLPAVPADVVPDTAVHAVRSRLVPAAARTPKRHERDGQPAALASLQRDLEFLAADYRVAAVRLCDLFPHTGHVEVLTLLERR